jgi:hypothetical protein
MSDSMGASRMMILWNTAKHGDLSALSSAEFKTALLYRDIIHKREAQAIMKKTSTSASTSAEMRSWSGINIGIGYGNEAMGP